MKAENINIGLAIEQRMNALGISKSELARRVGIANQNINRILDKPSIDTDKLVAICNALDYDFFALFNQSDGTTQNATANNNSVAAINSAVTVNSDSAVLCERVAMLEKLLEEKERTIQILMKKK